MSRASTSYYTILAALRDKLLSLGDTNTITAGDFSRIDIAKHTIFPLAHILVNSITQADNVLRYNITILCMDIVGTYDLQNEDLSQLDIINAPIRGYDNEQDVINTQAYVLNRLIQDLRQGDLFGGLYQLTGDVQIGFFSDRFENNLAGAEATIDITIPNDVSLC